ncbi:MAG: hypothetical protein ACHQQR_03965 [Gemmatimonadales bacterium]
MRVSSVWIVLSLIAAVLMAIASAAGALSGDTYARETVSWAAQGAGQDIVNVLVAFPLLAFGALYTHLGFARAHLVWIGALMYTAYSYVLYAFFVHFGPWFLVYVAILGLSTYALAGSVASLEIPKLPAVFTRAGHTRGAAAFLMFVGCTFAALWLGDIIPAVIAGRTPASVTASGFAVNPVHVLDLALFLPGTIATSVLLWKRRPLGLLFAVPFLVFTALMGLAIVTMTFMMRAHGLPADLAIVPVIGALVLCSVWFAARLLVDVRDEDLASAETGASSPSPAHGAGAIPTPSGRFR